MSVTIACPKCGSEQLSANKRGFSGGKALAGALLVGEIGLLAGTHGKNNIEITCLNCGKKFKPGEGEKKVIVSDGKGHSYDLNQLSKLS